MSHLEGTKHLTQPWGGRKGGTSVFQKEWKVEHGRKQLPSGRKGNDQLSGPASSPWLP